MHVPRTLTGLIGLGLLALGAAVGCNNASAPIATSPVGGLKRIVLLSNTNSPFWNSCMIGMQDADRELDLNKAGMVAILQVNNGTAEGQIDALQRLASQSDIAAVGLSAIDADNASLAEAMHSLKDKGVKVITVDSDMDRDMWPDVRSAFIGTDNVAGGREMGRCAKGLRAEGGEYAAFVGRTSAQNAIERSKGFAEGAGDKFKSAAFLADDHDEAKARENIRNAIANHPNLHTLVGIWAFEGPIIASVVKELDRKKDLTVVVFDADPLAIDQMGDGLIDAMVVQDPHEIGYQAVRLMKALVEDDQATIKKMLPKFGQKDGDVYHTGLKVVVPDMGSPLKADLFDKQTEFLKRNDFREWLNKHSLEGT